VPDNNFDITMGYVPGSIFHDMNNHNKYICTDSTNGAAVWELYYNPIPYKVYTALVTQTGSNDPVATVLENTLGGNLSWVRDTDGEYTGTLTGAFSDENQFFTINTERMVGPTTSIALEWLNSDSFKLYTSSVAFTPPSGPISYSGADNMLYNYSVEIRVYN
jgi:hypothetical protein